MKYDGQYDFDAPVNRIGTESFKWDLEGESGKYIPLGVADTDFRSPAPIVDAIRKKVDFGVFAYGFTDDERFSEPICGWFRRRHGVELKPEWVKRASGLMTGGMWLVINAFTRPADKILLQPPSYNTFTTIIENMGRFVENNDLILKDGRYEIDFEDLERKTADPRVRILIVCNPHNPVGRVWTKEELIRMAEICKKNHTLLLSDEIHGDIVYPGHRYIPYFSLEGDFADNIIVMGAPGKTFNLAALYTGYVIIRDEVLREQYQLTYEYYHCDYNLFGLEAMTAAYNECGEYVDQQNAYFLKNIGVVRDFLKENMPEVRLIEPEGTYLLWLDFRAWEMDDRDIEELFKKHGVKLNAGTRYGTAGKGFIRMNIATQTAVLKEALELMKEARREVCG